MLVPVLATLSIPFSGIIGSLPVCPAFTPRQASDPGHPLDHIRAPLVVSQTCVLTVPASAANRQFL